MGGRLVHLDRVSSGATTPRSLAVHGNVVYVLNTGDEPGIAGFTLEGDSLVAPPRSTRGLGAGSDPAQIAFSPDGRTLLITDRASDSIHAASDPSAPTFQPKTRPASAWSA